MFDRYYDPQTGQFISVDPLVDRTGQAYAYTGDDPVNKVDPMGLSSGVSGSPGYVSIGCTQTPTPARCKAGSFGTFLTAIGIIAGVVAAVTGVGVVADVAIAGLSVSDLSTVSAVAAVTASATDVPGCVNGSGPSKVAACFGALSGRLGGIGGISAPALNLASDYVRGLALLGVEGAGATAIFQISAALGGIKVRVRGESNSKCRFS